MPAPAPATLLIQTAFIGDVILATALVEYLAQRTPATPLDVLVRRGNEGLLLGNPHIRHVLIWDKKSRKYPNLLRLLGAIKRTQYGRVVTLQRFASTGFLTAFSGAVERVGFAQNPFSRLFTRRVPHVIGDGTHEVARNLLLLENDKLKIRKELVAEKTSASTGPQKAVFTAPFLIFNSTKPRLYPTPADEAAAAPYAAVGDYLC
ncbi:MAG: hypothetical protein EOO56_26810, partial [Hymenobacter sp.]